jgi:formate transporter
MSEQVFTPSGLDALPPPAMARRAEEIGEAKAKLPTLTILALSVLAGAFIALGAIFATTVMSNGDAFPYGVNRLLGGLTFSLGLILVVVAGAELFTGNNLIAIAWASRRVSTTHLLSNWTLVWVGNFAGAIATAGIMYFTRQYTFDHGAVGTTALTIANTKTSLGWGQALALGIFCNALVCLAVWLSYGARSVTDKILAIVFPISAFVAAGFEHSVANMYFISIGLFIKHDHTGLASLGTNAPDTSNITWTRFLWGNLVPVTLGNIVGGALMVGVVYWFIYLRPTYLTNQPLHSDELTASTRLDEPSAGLEPSGPAE